MRKRWLLPAAVGVVAPLWYVLGSGGSLLWLWVAFFSLSYIIQSEATR